MTDVFILIAFTSIWVLGLTIATQPTMIFGIFRKLAEGKDSIWMEPLILCHWCMPSIHGVFGYMFAVFSGSVALSWELISVYPIIVCGSSFICGVLWTIYKVLEHIEELTYFDSKDRKASYQRSKKR